MRIPPGSTSRRWLAGTLMVGALGAALLVACAGQERRRILTLLFDGVPPEDGGAEAPATSAGPGPQRCRAGRDGRTGLRSRVDAD